MAEISESAGTSLVVPVVHWDGAQHRRLIANTVNNLVMEHGGQPRWVVVPCEVQRDDVSGPGMTTLVNTNVKVMGFDPTNNEYAHFRATLPHGYNEGTQAVLNVRWLPTDSQTGVCVWRVEFLMCRRGATPIGPFGFAKEATASGSLIVNDVAMCNLTATRINTEVYGTIWRNANESGDTYPGDAGLLGVDLLLQIDAKGSQDRYTKYVVSNG